MKNQDNLFPIQSIICLSHRLEAIANKHVFQPMGFSSVSMKILKALSFHPHLSPSDLIEITNSTKSNISQRLNFLEKEGYIRRKYANDKDDKRKVSIRLTEPGKKKLKEIEKRFKKAHVSFIQKLTQKEISQLDIFFKKLNGILDSSENEIEKLFKN